MSNRNEDDWWDASAGDHESTLMLVAILSFVLGFVFWGLRHFIFLTATSWFEKVGFAFGLIGVAAYVVSLHLARGGGDLSNLGSLDLKEAFLGIIGIMMTLTYLPSVVNGLNPVASWSTVEGVITKTDVRVIERKRGPDAVDYSVFIRFPHGRRQLIVDYDPGDMRFSLFKDGDTVELLLRSGVLGEPVVWDVKARR